MKKISGIKYTVTLIILLSPCAYSQMEVSNLLNINTPQSNNTLIRRDKAEENRMIKEQKLYSYVTVKVTTTNQRKFDRDRDGYLSGNELQMYLRECYR